MVARFTMFAILLAIGVALLTSIIDPLQFYHKATWYSPVFSTEQRYQNPGLARNYDYDTIIIGTSMTENFIPAEVDKALGGKTLKLSIRGSTADEHFKIASLALQTGKVKKVLWGLDMISPLRLEIKKRPDLSLTTCTTTSCGTIINTGLTIPYISSSSRVLPESSRERLLRI